MKAFKIFLILPVAVILSFVAQAQQGEVRMTASLAAGMPTGDLKDLVDKTSFRGADVSVLYGLSEQISLGLNVGFQDFYQKFPRALYKLDDGSDISAVLTNSIQTIPFLATVKYDFATGGAIKPYLSAGAGGAAVISRQYVGEHPNSNDKISFAARPGAGVYIPFRKGGEVGVNLGVNYTYIPFKQGDVSNLSYAGVTLGIGFPMRN